MTLQCIQGVTKCVISATRLVTFCLTSTSLVLVLYQEDTHMKNKVGETPTMQRRSGIQVYLSDEEKPKVQAHRKECHPEYLSDSTWVRRLIYEHLRECKRGGE